MEFRKEIMKRLSAGKSWKEIAREVELEDEELNSIASGMTEYQSEENPKYEAGEKVLFFVDEEEYYCGEVAAILPKRGELYPEFEYVIRWEDGLEETLWEQQVINYVNEYHRNQWLF